MEEGRYPLPETECKSPGSRVRTNERAREERRPEDEENRRVVEGEEGTGKEFGRYLLNRERP